MSEQHDAVFRVSLRRSVTVRGLAVDDQDLTTLTVQLRNQIAGLTRRCESMQAVVEAARVLLETPDPADLDTISGAIVGLNAALNNLDKEAQR